MTKAWGGNNQWQEYAYNADGHRVRRKIDGVETWHVYGMEGELLAEYPANGAATSPKKEYGYRNGELLITAANTQACGVGYSGTKTWTATSPSLGHATGQQEGSNWAVYVASHSPNAMVFGPYDSTFGQGQHTAQFWLMVDNNSGTDVVATIDVVTNYGSNNLAQRLIRRNEFVAANQWQVFTLEFNNPCFGLVESRVWWSGTVNMKFSQVTITATNTSALDLEWLVTDHLGTPRMVVNKSGSLAGVKRHDYLPFGEELYAGVSSRTVEHGYTGDGVRQKFTSKERDNETGLDYFLARYYANTQGRFMSIDLVAGSLTNPQSLNRYSYVLNNPLKFIDPTGMIVEWSDSKKEKKKNETEARTNAQRKYENHIAKLLESKNPDERARGERLLENYDRLKASKATFQVVSENSGSSSGELSFNGKVFIVSLKGSANEYGALDTNQKIAHEFEHGRQVLDRELSYHNFDPPDWKPWDLDRTDEAKAFAAGFDATPVAPDQGSFMTEMRQAVRSGGIQGGADYLGRSKSKYRYLPAGPKNVTHRSPSIYEVPK